MSSRKGIGSDAQSTGEAGDGDAQTKAAAELLEEIVVDEHDFGFDGDLDGVCFADLVENLLDFLVIFQRLGDEQDVGEILDDADAAAVRDPTACINGLDGVGDFLDDGILLLLGGEVGGALPWCRTRCCPRRRRPTRLAAKPCRR